MNGLDPQQLGKWLIIAGIAVILLGGMVILLARLGFFRLPGDIHLRGRNWQVYIPLATCIILSIMLTLIMWLINYFRR